MPLAPWSNWASLGFLGIVIYLMIFESGQFAIFQYGLPVLILMLAAGWVALRKQHGQAI
jgi:L-asparagine permease